MRDVGHHIGVMGRLRFPYAFEFVFDMAALRVEIVSLRIAVQAHAGILAFGQPGGKKLAHRLAPGRTHGFVQRLAAAGYLAVRAVLLAAFGFAVRLEPAPLVEMEQRAPDLVTFQRVSQRPGTQTIGIFIGQKACFVGIGRHQPAIDKCLQECGTPPKISITPSPHSTGAAPVDRQGGAGLGITAIAEDARTQRDDMGIILDQAPAYAVGSDVQTEPAHNYIRS